jgi:hypothetical protein
MASSVVPAKFGLGLGISFLLWIVPVSVKAPRFAILLSFLGSITGFSYCFVLAGPLHQSLQTARKREILRDETSNYQFALEEESTKERLMAHYFPPSAQMAPAAIAQAQRKQETQQLQEEPTEEANDFEALALKFLEYVHGKGARYAEADGWFSVSRLQQHWGKNYGFNSNSFLELLQLLTQVEAGEFKDSNQCYWKPLAAE